MSQCPKCGNELKLVPAGTSKKTGKPYDSFWSCADRNCGFTMKNQATGAPAKAMSSVAAKNNDQKDLEKSTGMVRHGFAIEAFKKDMPLNSATANKIIAWTNFVMTSKLDKEQATEETTEEITPEKIPF